MTLARSAFKRRLLVIKGRKFRYSIVGTVVLLLIFAGANLIFSDPPPTFKAWKEKALQACTIMTDQNNAAYIKIIDPFSVPHHDATLADFIAFEKYFEPDFEAFEIKLNSLDRPKEQRSKVDEFLSAVEGYRKNLQKSARSYAAAKAEFAADGQTDASMRFGIASSALGLEKCVG